MFKKKKRLMGETELFNGRRVLDLQDGKVLEIHFTAMQIYCLECHRYYKNNRNKELGD